MPYALTTSTTIDQWFSIKYLKGMCASVVLSTNVDHDNHFSSALTSTSIDVLDYHTDHLWIDSALQTTKVAEVNQ